jgi:hypothetical protein
MEDALLIFEFLPRLFKTDIEQEYIDFLWDTFESNYRTGKYQFAYLAFHMLVMSFVYFTIWKIRYIQPKDFEKALVGFERYEKEIIQDKTPFAFSLTDEKPVFRFLRLINCDNDKIGKYKKLVDSRNKVAHSTGQIIFKDKGILDEAIVETLKLVAEIAQQSKCVILECYETFLIESNNPETRDYSVAADQIREILIHENYFSQKDVAFCLAFDIAHLRQREDFTGIQALHSALLAEYQTNEG